MTHAVRNIFLTAGWLAVMPGFAWASAHPAGEASLQALPAWTVLPFLGILLSIAVIPLLSARWWEHNFGRVSLFWLALALLTMFLAAPAESGFARTFGGEIFHTCEEYISFIILLGSLFVITGGIVIRGSLSGRPATNVTILAIGALLASFMGTTGAAMLLVRPLIKSIRWREYNRHIIIFFIFLVCNIGGSLTPIGDPPLFIGFLRGVPFLWTFVLTPVWLSTTLLVLGIFWLIDRHLMKREAAVPPDMEKKRISIAGAVNFWLIGGVLASVLISGLVDLGEINLGFGRVAVQNIGRDLVMVALAAASLWLTPRPLRQENNFNWAPIREVALLFAGIFVTMIPALMLLHQRGAELGVDTAPEFFWITGVLSSVLDNTPTYMTFLETAKAVLGMTVAQLLADPRGVAFLKAISVGAVFMGANTYIGNGPNFMVKAIAEQENIQMPSFFGYTVWSGLVLLPVFLLVDLVFFR